MPRRELEEYGLPLPQVVGFRPPRRGRRQSRVQRTMSMFRTLQAQQAAQQIPQFQPGTRIPRGRRKAPITQTGDPRNIMVLIQEYAKARRTVILTYKKATENGKIVKREVEPYSIRVKTTKRRGRRRYFYSYCYSHMGIHSFLVDNIVSVQGTNRRFIPRWKVEF